MTDEKALMPEVPYASAMSSLMYTMVCTPRHCSSSGSCLQVHEQSRKGLLESCKVNIEISGKGSDMVLCYNNTDVHLHGYVLRLCG